MHKGGKAIYHAIERADSPLGGFISGALLALFIDVFFYSRRLLLGKLLLLMDVR
jgi:hypothetical protein